MMIPGNAKNKKKDHKDEEMQIRKTKIEMKANKAFIIRLLDMRSIHL